MKSLTTPFDGHRTTQAERRAGSSCIDVRVRDLTFNYGEVLVFRNMSIVFGGGRVSALLGASGSGKSTLLKLIVGLHGPGTASSIPTFGDAHTSTHEVARVGKVGFCPQRPSCLPWATVLENVVLPFRLRGAPPDTDHAMSLLRMFGLEKWSTAFPHELSQGMIARVAIARTFALQPTLVLLDEPFASLDVGWKDAMYAYLELATTTFGATTLIVTHDIHEALCVADDIFLVNAAEKSIRPAVMDNPLRASERPSLGSVVQHSRFVSLFQTLQQGLQSHATP